MTALSRKLLFISSALLVCLPAAGRAQEPSPPKPDDKPAAAEPAKEERSTGLPSSLNWKFNFDAGWGGFGFGNSLYINTHDPGVSENLSDNWMEGFVRPGLSATYTLESKSEIYGKLSAVGERNYMAPPALVGSDASSFLPEDAYIGWRSGTSIAWAENAIDISAGRAPFQLGHGFLVYDGASEGGSRGGYWSGARKAFKYAAIARIRPHDNQKFEAFYLDRDELPESHTGSGLWGLNYEFAIGKDASTTLGASYLNTHAHADLKPGRAGMDVYNLRAYTAPLPNAPGLSFEFEYAAERNGDILRSNAWTGQGAYEFSKVSWKPKVTYRYAFFEGDNPATSTSEAFDPLFLGFYDWGTWWQGEIAGEYFLSNSNLASHQIRVHLVPTSKLGTGVILYDFLLDHPEAFGPEVTSNKAATEADWYTDWKVNGNFTVSFVAAFANPGTAVKQYTGRTDNFRYGMVYVAYSY